MSTIIPSSVIESISPTSMAAITSIVPTATLDSIAPIVTSNNLQMAASDPFDISWNDSTSTKYLSDAQHAANIGSQFTICVIVGLICFLAFCIFRTRVPVLFSPRSKLKRHKPPELPTSLFGWIWPLLKIGDEEMLNNVGLDSLLMLKFITMSIKIFSLCMLFGIIVFVPITMTSDNSEEDEVVSPVSRISFGVLERGSPKLIAYLVFAYVFTLITFFFLNRTFNDYTYLRTKYLLKHSKSLTGRSIVVTNIPEHLRSDKALSDYYENLGIGAVESCYVVRTIHRLNTMIKKRAEALIRLEEAYADYWGNPCKIPGYDPDRIVHDNELYEKIISLAENGFQEKSKDDAEKIDDIPSTSSSVPDKKTSRFASLFKCCSRSKEKKTKKPKKSKRPTVRIGGFMGCGGKKVDAIEYYTKLFNDLDKIVNDRRRSPNYEMTNAAFVTFEHMSSAVIASQIAISPKPFNLMTSMAYEPRDVLWNAIAMRGPERIIREIIIWTITVIICITWFFPVGAISSMLSIDTIAKLNPGLGERLENNSAAKLILNSFIPPLILNIFTSILPTFFDRMGYYQGLKSRSAVAESTLSKQYFFLIFFTLIFYSVVGTTAMTIITDFTDNPKKIPEFLADSLPTLAPFFINYTILQGFLIMPLNLLLLGAIIVRGINHLFFCKTPREYARNKTPWSFNYGIGYPAPLLVFAIVFEYSLINPLVLLFGTVYFCFTYLVYKYQFLYVYFRPYEVAGKLWTMTIPRIIFTMVLFQLTMMGLFFLKGSYVLGGLVVPLIALTFLFRFILYRAYKKNAFNVPMQLLRDNLDENGKLIKHGSDSSDDDMSEDEVNEKQPTDSNSGSGKDGKAEDTQKSVVRNRWKRAAFTAVNMKRSQELQLETAVAGARPHKVLLDEDDYRAVPDKLTDYRQPPMQLNPGLLDTGLKTYGNPLLIGHLPQLWLPVKLPDTGADNHEKAEEAHQKKKEFLQRRDTEDGGLLAQHMADVLRKVEREKRLKLNKTESIQEQEAENALIEESRKTAHEYATSIVSARPANPRIKALRRLFQKGAIKKSHLSEGGTTPAEQFRLQHVGGGDEIDEIERGEHNVDGMSIKSSVQSIHHTYYHHPERRKSHLPEQAELLKSNNKSSPAVLTDDREPKPADFTAPESNLTRLKSDRRLRTSSSPALYHPENVTDEPAPATSLNRDILHRLRAEGRLNNSSSPSIFPLPQPTENENEEIDNPLNIVPKHDKDA